MLVLIYQQYFKIFTFEIWLKSVIEVWFGVLVNWGVSGLDGDFWVEGSKSVMEESNKFSFRWYEFLFPFDLFIIFWFCSSILILSFTNYLLTDLKSTTLTIYLWIILISARLVTIFMYINLDQNINESKSHTWTSFLNFIWGIQLNKKSITRSLIIFKKLRKMTNDFFNNYIFVRKFQWTSSEFIFNFTFSSRKS